MSFTSMTVWVRAHRTFVMMNQFYGDLTGKWIGNVERVDVDKDGMAWGEYLRIRVEIPH